MNNNNSNLQNEVLSMSAWKALRYKLKPNAKRHHLKSSCYGVYNVYDFSQVEPIVKVRKYPGKPLQPTSLNDVRSLHTLCKPNSKYGHSTSIVQVESRNYMGSTSQIELENINTLKYQAIEKLKKEVELRFAGIYRQRIFKSKMQMIYHYPKQCGCQFCEAYLQGNTSNPGFDKKRRPGVEIIYLECFEALGYGFYRNIDADKLPKEEGITWINDLGKWYSEHSPSKPKITLKNAICTLEEYLSTDKEIPVTSIDSKNGTESGGKGLA